MVVVVVVVYLSIYLFIYLSIYLIYLSIYLSVDLQAWKRSYPARRPQFLNLTTSKNAAILRDFLNFWTWQHQKQSNSARLPQFSTLTTSKTKQLWETSFKNGRWRTKLTASCQCVLRFFHSMCLNKVSRLPRKSDARSYEMLHLSRKKILANLKIWCSKMQPLSLTS